jgi:hypothetical protein
VCVFLMLCWLWPNDARLVKKLKRMVFPAFTDLPSPAQHLDFFLALTHTQHAWRLKD